MKKKVFAVAVLASASAAMAQSNVTVFGIVDAGVAHLSGTGAGSTTGLVSGGNGTSRLGFRGTEDLGGGLSAGFWVEGQLNNDVGAGATQTTGFDFARRSTVSLMGPFGEIRLGRDFVASYLSMIAFDVWGQRGIGNLGNYGPGVGGINTYIRNSNTIAYFLPANLGGFYGTAQYAFGEQSSNRSPITNAAGIASSAANAGTDKTGNYLGGRFGYASGPLDVALSYGQYSDAIRTTGIAAAPFYSENYRMGNIGASYDFGPLKAVLFAQQEKVDGRSAAPDFRFNTYSIGATAPIGAGLLRAQVARYDNKTAGGAGNDANQFAIGYSYFLSKRTSVYADVARLSNKGNASYILSNMSSSLTAPVPSGGGNSTGYVVGIRHAF